MRVAIITASTEIYRGNAGNESGEAIMEMVEEAGFEITYMGAIPNDREVLAAVMTRITDTFSADLVLTTGGAGCGPSDCTPEATMDIIEKQIVGIPEAMRAYTMKLTKRAMLNRSVAGIRGDVLIVNLPGKAQAVRESLKFLMPELVHAVEVIQGEA
ncbi:MAG: MogA/MoaB family molybdenum cofactor biosynthesis protein [Dorea sp.]|jgi:molybdopterin adenylyltransferase|nr:MogA/MoaB family molybdenum cofactor biosynthesis protein [Dorea sp.]GFI43940.1 molybdopterin adenylyltransferase [Lachnospiraceae bacterium]